MSTSAHRPDLRAAHRGAMVTMSIASTRLARVSEAADRWLLSGDHPRPAVPTLPLVPLLVLVVDDEQAILSIVRRILERDIEGCTVLMAHSARAARALLSATSAALPSVVLLDLNLGDALGWDIAAELPADVRVILMSGAVDDARLTALATQLGARWLAKPLKLETLVAVVRAEMRLPPSPAPPDSEPPLSGPEAEEDDTPSLPRGDAALSQRG